MESIAAFDKVKNPVIALIGGIILGGSLTWTATDKLHEERVKIYEAEKTELKNQLVNLSKTIEGQNAELKNLNSKLSTVQNASYSSRERLVDSMQSLIAQLDAEIKKKKLELAMNSQIEVITENGRDVNKSDGYLRLEKELAALNEQRDLARKKQIENLSCQGNM